jgi:FemAB-related protein (PEP-CTERM system-associated)
MKIDLMVEPDSTWDNFVNQNCYPGYSLFKLSNWYNVICNTYKFRSHYLLAVDDSKIIGAFPIVLVKSKIFGNRLISLPFTGYGCGPIISKNHEQVLREFHGKILEIAEQTDVKFVEIRDPPKDIIKILENIGYVSKLKYSNFFLDISKSEEDVWLSFHKQVRNSIKRAENTGLKIVSGTIDELYKLHLRVMRELGTPPHKKSFYYNVANIYGSNFKILFAEFKNEKISAVSFIKNNNCIIWLDGFCPLKYKTLNPISFLLWNAIKWAKENHCTLFDFGDSREPSGNFDFKKRWGTTIVNSPRYYFFLNKSAVVDPRMDKYNKNIERWKKLPLIITKLIGPWLRNQIGA